MLPFFFGEDTPPKHESERKHKLLTVISRGRGSQFEGVFRPVQGTFVVELLTGQVNVLLTTLPLVPIRS